MFQRQLLIGALGIAAIVAMTVAGAAQDHADHVAPPAPAQTSVQSQGMPGMMKMHQQMMADMKAAEVRLDALVKDMNSASGDAKIAAMAAVVTELVAQHKSMCERMGQMHPETMGGRGMTTK